MTTNVKRDGVFPYYVWTTTVPWVDGAMPLGKGLSAPRVTAALAESSTSVRITYDSEMKHVSASNSDDSLNPANYAFGVTGGVARNAQSVSLFQASPTIVIVALDGEMTNGADYSVTVSSVLGVDGSPLDTLYNHLHFAGLGVAPRVSTALATVGRVTIQFNEAMDNNVALVTKTNYTFTGPTTLTANTATRLDSTHVEVETVEGMLDGGAYTAHVATGTGIEDIAWNGLDPAHATAAFTGVGVLPEVTGAVSRDSMTVRVTFSMTVDESTALEKTNYAIEDSLYMLLSITNVVKISGTQYDLTTASQTSFEDYLLTVTGVEDLIGNPVVPPHNTATFTGKGYSPPAFIFGPPTRAVDVPIDAKAFVNAFDLPRGTSFSGIDISTWVIQVSYPGLNGFYKTETAVKDGVLQAGYHGTLTGDPMSYDGVTCTICPASGYWLPETLYTISTYVKDNEGAGNDGTSYFTTGAAPCFEQVPHLPTAFDTLMLQPLDLTNAEKLRRLLLENTTRSTNNLHRARTVMFFATATDLRTVLAGAFDFSLVDGIKLCLRRDTLTVYRLIQRYRSTVLGALGEIQLTREGKNLLQQYLNSNSPIYAVNAAAAIIILAVSQSGSFYRV